MATTQGYGLPAMVFGIALGLVVGLFAGYEAGRRQAAGRDGPDRPSHAGPGIGLQPADVVAGMLKGQRIRARAPEELAERVAEHWQRSFHLAPDAAPAVRAIAREYVNAVLRERASLAAPGPGMDAAGAVALARQLLGLQAEAERKLRPLARRPEASDEERARQTGPALDVDIVR